MNPLFRGKVGGDGDDMRYTMNPLFRGKVGGDGDDMRYTMNPLSRGSQKRRMSGERTDSKELPEPLTTSPLHRPELEKPYISSDSDDEYASIYTLNPMRPKAMAIPSVTEGETKVTESAQGPAPDDL